MHCPHLDATCRHQHRVPLSGWSCFRRARFIPLHFLRAHLDIVLGSCRGRHVAIVAFGGGKAEIVQRALEVQSLPGALPAQLVRPIEGKLTWLLDIESAQQLRVGEWQSSKAFPRSNGQQAQEVSVGSA